MMKMTRKKMMMTASAFALGALLFAGGVALAAPSGNYIGSEKAQQIALENAGLSACLVHNKNTQSCRGDSSKLQREFPQ